jgi:A/G-specific adenine glycosylase
VSTRQAPFEGSARQARGRVLAALADGPRPVCDFDDHIVAGLLADGLIEVDEFAARLPTA